MRSIRESQLFTGRIRDWVYLKSASLSFTGVSEELRTHLNVPKIHQQIPVVVTSFNVVIKIHASLECYYPAVVWNQKTAHNVNDSTRLAVTNVDYGREIRTIE